MRLKSEFVFYAFAFRIASQTGYTTDIASRRRISFEKTKRQFGRRKSMPMPGDTVKMVHDFGKKEA